MADNKTVMRKVFDRTHHGDCEARCLVYRTSNGFQVEVDRNDGKGLVPEYNATDKLDAANWIEEHLSCAMADYFQQLVAEF